MTDHAYNKPTDQPTDRSAHREVTFPITKRKQKVVLVGQRTGQDKVKMKCNQMYVINHKLKKKTTLISHLSQTANGGRRRLFNAERN